MKLVAMGHTVIFWDESEQNSRHSFFCRNQNFEENDLQSSRFLKNELEFTKKGYFTTRQWSRSLKYIKKLSPPKKKNRFKGSGTENLGKKLIET